MSAALPIAALAALTLAAKLRRGSRSWSDVDPLEHAKAEAERLAAVMREERGRSVHGWVRGVYRGDSGSI